MAIIGRHLASALGSLSAGLTLVAAIPALAVCEGLPDHGALRSALTEAVAATGGPARGRLALHLSATSVDRHGTVCAVDMSVAYGGEPAGDGAARNPVTEVLTGNRIGASVLGASVLGASVLGAGGPPLGGDRIAVGAGFATSGHVRKGPPLTAGQLTALRRRALRQGF